MGLVRLPREADVTILTSNLTGLGNILAELSGLIKCAPERRADGHGGDLSAGILVRIGFTGHLILLGQPGVEYPAEVHIAAVAASANDDALPRPDVHGLALVRCRNSKNPSR